MTIIKSAGVIEHGLIVSKIGHALVDAVVEPSIHQISKEGLGFNAVMPGFSATADEFVFYLQNMSSDQDLIIERIEFNSVQNAVFKIHSVTGTAAAGSIITPVSMHRPALKTAEVTCLGGGATITGLVLGDLVGIKNCPANDNRQLNFGQAMSLGQNEAIMVEYDVGTTGLCYIECIFYYE